MFVDTLDRRSARAIADARATRALEAAAPLAQSQGGVVRRGQLRGAGLSYQQIATLAAHGRLEARLGMLVIPEHVPQWVAERPPHFRRAWLDAWALTLRAGVDAVITGAGAAVLQGCFGDWRGRWEGGRDMDGDWPAAHALERPALSLPRGTRWAMPGVHVVRATFDGAAVPYNGLCLADRTTALLDAVDLVWAQSGAPQKGDASVTALVDFLFQRKWLDPQEVVARERARRASGREGRRRSRALAHAAKHALTGCQSQAEREFARLLKARGFRCGGAGGWFANHEVRGVEASGRHWCHRFDFAWPTARVAVDVDGRSYHMSDGAFERDRHVAALAEAEGWRVIAVTWKRMVSEPDAVIANLRAVLAHAGMRPHGGAGTIAGFIPKK